MLRNRFVSRITYALVLAPCLFLASPRVAQAQSAAAPVNLKQAFDAAWTRQPEARSLDLRRDAVEAHRRAADQWTAEPPSLELSGKTDQMARNQGNREYAATVALPLWLPGERDRSAALADAESGAVGSRVSAAQWRFAAVLRESWWNWQRARSEQSQARDRLDNAKRLAADVAKRVKAGDLARADLHQAEGAAANAEVVLAEADSVLATARQRVRALTGVLPEEEGTAAPEPLPEMPADFATLAVTHPALRELHDRTEVARRSADLASVQTRNNPELLLGTTRDRSAYTESWQQTITIGVRVPFGSENRNRAKVGQARAEAVETEEAFRLESERLVAEIEAARVRVDSARAQLTAAEKRARLARETRGFYEKSFRLGESDLPTRLRIELEAVEAERQVARTRIDLAAAISSLRQALGLLPEQSRGL